ncbi:WD repeat and FYVE domain-containing protein 2-like isoform X1 [Patiria miniata]|uniref:FYVE-type domain-containing protein n=1 Tax=Patiria miniata TaxID=46514 RepID=A0A913ZHA8_PATMI|nr:WD repeat and FYVE domain-containing protein 2-like isoform X1 [Patiria miniata]
MAAEIRTRPQTRRPILLSKLEGCNGTVTKAVIIPKEDGVISVSEDRTVRVWLKRDSGLYWPSICHSMQASCSTLEFNPQTRRMFVGLDNGNISEFSLSEDFNSLKTRREYLAHQSRVTDVSFSVLTELVLSLGRDKYFQWHCSESGRRLGGYKLDAWGTALQFDEETKHAFIADYSGQITVLKVMDSGHQVITTLKGHSVPFLFFRLDKGSTRCLAWDAENKLLFSGSFDQSIIVWDIGGQKGTAFELQGHTGKVESVCYSARSKQLFSAGDDNNIVVWNMAAKRQETPEWEESDCCQKCSSPFFWNFKEMWTNKTLGVRQHHCRKCGHALCDKCTPERSTLPAFGFEFEVRICKECADTLTDADRAPMASFYDSKHAVVSMHLDDVKGQLVTCGTDKVIKLWDVSTVIQ